MREAARRRRPARSRRRARAPGSASATCAMRHGSETPLASITTASNASGASSTRISARAQVVADRQQTQPLRQRDRVAAVRRDQFGVDVERAEVVDQHREAPAVALGAAAGSAAWSCRRRESRRSRSAAGAPARSAPCRVSRPAMRARGPPSTVPATRTSFSAVGRDRERIVVEHAEVGALAAPRCEPISSSSFEREGGAQRDRVQRVGDARCARLRRAARPDGRQRG